MSKAKWGDNIPHVERDADGMDHWFIHGEPRNQLGGPGTVMGAMPDRTVNAKNFDEMPKECYVPSERRKAMERDGVDVHTFFGNIAGIASNTFTNPDWPADFRMDCIKAFNDFQVEAYAQPYPGRFITLANLPLWDVDLAVQETNRAIKMGMKGVSIAFPQQWGFPHIVDHYWDPLWSVCQDNHLSINLHIGRGAAVGAMTAAVWDGHSRLLRLAEGSTRAISANIQVMSTMLFSGILERFPKLMIVSSESGLGWVPYLLEVADHQWTQQNLHREGMTIKPSEYFHRQCYVNFWFEVIGCEMRNYIGIDNIMWESDFPHPTCTYPNSQDYIQRAMKDWSPEERQKVLVDNALKVFRIHEN